MSTLFPSAAQPGVLARVRTHWDEAPLRARLVGIMVVLLVAALALTGFASQYVLRSYLVGKIDTQLNKSLEEVGEAGIVESYIAYLRRKIDDVEPPLIHTKRGVGYVLRQPPQN